MNFLPARIEQNGEGLIVRLSEALTFPIRPRIPSVNRVSVGKDLVFGLRPEHITRTARGSP